MFNIFIYWCEFFLIKLLMVIQFQDCLLYQVFLHTMIFLDIVSIDQKFIY